MLTSEIPQNFDFGAIEGDLLLKKVRYPLNDAEELVIVNASAELNAPKQAHHHYSKGFVYLRNLETGEFTFVSFPLVKFYNSFEGQAQEDLAKILARNEYFQKRVVTKEDGTLIQRFIFREKVYWTTRGRIISLEADNEFKGLLEEVLASSNGELQNPALYKNYTFVFELVSPKNYIGQIYAETKLILIAVLAAFGGKDLSFVYHSDLDSFAKTFGVSRAEIHTFLSPEEALASIPESEIKEGFIVEYLSSGVELRIKYKSEAYLTFIRLKNNMSEKRVYELCLENNLTSLEAFEVFFDANFNTSGSYEEILQYVRSVWPEVTTRLEKLTRAKNLVYSVVEELKGLEKGRVRWELAVKATGNSSLAGIVMSLLDGKEVNVLALLGRFVENGGEF